MRNIRPANESIFFALKSKIYRLGLLVVLLANPLCHAREIALTFDDAPTADSALMTGNERTSMLIAALQNAQVPDALFYVKADGINKDTQNRLDQYMEAGFHLANHSYSHQAASALGHSDYIADVNKAHMLLKDQKNFLPYHRFPYLDCGKDASSILSIQKSLSDMGYKDGYITISNYDWHISTLLSTAVEKNKKIDYENAKEFYVKTLYDAIEFYDGLAKETLGRSPKHILLLHENDATALFVDDLVSHLREKGWKIISPQQAYEDPMSLDLNNISYHQQNRLAAIAQRTGVSEHKLHHVSESIDYLNEAFAAAGILF